MEVIVQATLVGVLKTTEIAAVSVHNEKVRHQRFGNRRLETSTPPVRIHYRLNSGPHPGVFNPVNVVLRS